MNIFTNWITSSKTFLIIIVVFVLLGLVARFTYSNMQNKIAKLEKEKLELNSLLVVEKANNITAKSIIENQNRAIDSQKVEYSEKLQELEDWKNQSPEVKYKEVIKYKEVKSNECEDIKNIINSIRSTSF